MTKFDKGAAVVVGISKYQYAGVLPGTVTNDSSRFRDLLVDESVCAYDPSRVHLIQNEGATKAAILEAIERLARLCEEDSTTMFFISGHGSYLKSDKNSCFLLPVESRLDTDDNTKRTAISSAEFSSAWGQVRAKRKVVILDCCYAAGIVAMKGIRNCSVELGVTDRLLDSLGKGRGNAVLSSSRADQESFAWQYRDDENSLFSKYVLAGLEGGAPNQNGLIHVFDLFKYVQKNVSATGWQHPVFKGELEEDFPIAMWRGGAKHADDLPVSESEMSLVQQAAEVLRLKQLLKDEKEAVESHRELERLALLKDMSVDSLIASAEQKNAEFLMRMRMHRDSEKTRRVQAVEATSIREEAKRKSEELYEKMLDREKSITEQRTADQKLTINTIEAIAGKALEIVGNRSAGESLDSNDQNPNDQTPSKEIECEVQLGSTDKLKCLTLSGRDVDDSLLLSLEPVIRQAVGVARGIEFPNSIEDLDKLRILRLYDTSISDQSLKSIARLGALEELRLDRTQVTDRGVAELVSLQRLRRLWLSSTQVTDDSLQWIGKLTSLRELRLQSTRVTNAGLTQLSELKRLNRIFLIGTQVDKSGCNVLKQMLGSGLEINQ